jgi:hypothetical protein
MTNDFDKSQNFISRNMILLVQSFLELPVFAEDDREILHSIIKLNQERLP